ncbi:MAG TPA: divalent-cation tolerance protein CutA [Gammaproteobacteria bacterium]
MTHQIVLTTCPDQESADALAVQLVESRLAACVNIVPGIRSVYRWKGEVLKETELLLVIKSSSTCFESLKEAILARHPYELPEVIAVAVNAGHLPYLAWIDSQLDTHQ